MLNIAHMELGSSVLAADCGGVGLNVIQGAVLAGATTIIAADMVPAKLDPAALFSSRRLMGCSGGDAVPRRDLPRLAELYARGRLKLDEFITERLPLDRVNEAVARVRAGGVARSVIVLG